MSAWVLVIIGSMVRVLWMARRVRYLGDEYTYRDQARIVREHGLRATSLACDCWLRAPALHLQPAPSRWLYTWLGALAIALRPARSMRGLAWVSTLAGVAALACVPALARSIGADPIQATLLVSTAPLVVGMGRRALADSTELLGHMVALYGLYTGHWLLACAGLCWALAARESTFVALPAMLLIGGVRHGLDWGLVSVPAAVVIHTLVSRALTGQWWWVFRRATTRCFATLPAAEQRAQYGYRRLRGGLHRLLVDAMLVSPAVVLGLVLCRPAARDWAPIMVAMICYALPNIVQQVRQMLWVDVLARVVLAMYAPWWLVVLVVVVDADVFYRFWFRGRVYDPTTAELTQAGNMS